MSVKLVRCGPFANQSERHAGEYLKARLEGVAGERPWVMLSNYASSSSAQHLSDELDILVIGPPGIFIIEIKHWSAADLKRNDSNTAGHEAEKLNDKAKRLAGRLRRSLPFEVGFVEGRLLLTKGEQEKFAEALGRRRVRGIDVFGLTEWKDLLGTYRTPCLSDGQILSASKLLQPNLEATSHDEIRAFEEFFDLEPVSGPQDPFRRVFRGRRKPSRDRVVLHIYDLSATKDKNALELARREFDALQRLQKSPWLPSLMDSFQEATRYPGELFFFSYLDTEAACLAAWAQDQDWPTSARVQATRKCVEALLDLHSREAPDPASPVLHRNLNPESIRIRSNGEPLLTQLHLAKLPGAVTVAGSSPVSGAGVEEFVAPEVRASGLGASTIASDVYALCASLSLLFIGSTNDDQAIRALAALATGLEESPERRCSLQSLIDDLQFAPPRPEVSVPRLPVAFWDEDTIKELHGRHYRIATKLGAGGVGATFKVMEVDPESGNELSGPYVAKAITNRHVGIDAARAYAKVRAQTGTPHLAGVLEVLTDWQPDEITALLKWVKGDPLSDWTGVLPLYFDDLNQGPREEIALRWLSDICTGLAQLHQVGLVHGDVSPRNIIVDGSNVTLTDFDLSAAAGSVPLGGTPLYCGPDVAAKIAIQPSDDVFALAASIFHVLFDREPFLYSGGLDKRRGLNWSGIERSEWTRIGAFLDRATHPEPTKRLSSAMEAIAYVESLGRMPEAAEEPADGGTVGKISAPLLTENVVGWLDQLLQSYPGSPKGNAETRGLDSAFARQTYVETSLDSLLEEEIRAGRVSLVVLCGNAGDGKTAFLQNLAVRLGLEVGTSAQRLWDFSFPGGLRIRANLDGSAAYQGRSATDLLDEFFAPFQAGEFPEQLVHLIAINDGPLLAWLNEADDSYLTEQLYSSLDAEQSRTRDPRIRFIDLNARSLVGGYSSETSSMSTDFVDMLLEKMLSDADSVWEPCRTCTAQVRCHARRSVRVLRDAVLSPVVRERLARALLAVHQRGEIHITARSLRAALVYIFFGTDSCTDLHANPSYSPPLYYDRAFDANSSFRQGELLTELQWLDPALESHPHVDRFLLREDPAGFDRLEDEPGQLSSLRRQAYFEWDERRIREIGGSTNALGLARGRYLLAFLRIGIGTDAEREAICTELCDGIARLEDLPKEAFAHPRFVPLKITPRTPTETAFWVNKPRSSFALRARNPGAAPGIETLHTHVILTYTFDNGHHEDLVIGGDLFHLLMEIKDGYQISDSQSDDVFANLSIFKQRLAQEGDRTLMAWTPLDDRVFEVTAIESSEIQTIQIRDAS